MCLEVGKGDAIVNSSADTLTTCIYNFRPTCVDFSHMLRKRINMK